MAHRLTIGFDNAYFHLPLPDDHARHSIDLEKANQEKILNRGKQSGQSKKN
jgi:hypothetical protein